MKKLEDLNCYEVLNVEPLASREEIEKAYLLALATFRPDGFATYSVLSDDEREASLKRVEQAFEVLRDPVKRRMYDLLLGQAGPHRLSAEGAAVEPLQPPATPEVTETPAGFWERLGLRLRPHSKQPERAASENPQPDASSLAEGYMLSRGHYLKTIRLSRGLSLETLSQRTRISITYLRALEEEEYDVLPSGSYLDYMLAAYAKSLKLDPDWILRDFRSNQKI
jgi:curved DNA-binding protein CbpA